MTAAELIEQLKAYPGEMEVIVASYEEGFDPVTDLQLKAVEKVVDKSWYVGIYDDVTDSNHKAVLIHSRYNRMDLDSEK